MNTKPSASGASGIYMRWCARCAMSQRRTTDALVQQLEAKRKEIERLDREKSSAQERLRGGQFDPQRGDGDLQHAIERATQTLRRLRIEETTLLQEIDTLTGRPYNRDEYSLVTKLEAIREKIKTLEKKRSYAQGRLDTGGYESGLNQAHLNKDVQDCIEELRKIRIDEVLVLQDLYALTGQSAYSSNPTQDRKREQAFDADVRGMRADIEKHMIELQNLHTNGGDEQREAALVSTLTQGLVRKLADEIKRHQDEMDTLQEIMKDVIHVR